MTRARRRTRTPETDDAGMVTAEMAVALPVLAVVLAGCIGLLSAISLQVRCVDAAGLAARAAARGDPVAGVTETADADLGGAIVKVGHDGDLVRVTVTALSHPLGQLGPAVPVTAQADALAGSDDP